MRSASRTPAAPGAFATGAIELGAEEARRIAVATQGFAARRRQATRGEVEAAIDRLGCVQIDSVSAVARAHRLTLASRVGRLPDGVLNGLRRDARVFEYWAHEACLVPIADYRFYRGRMAGRRIHHWFGPVLDEHAPLARQILADIEREGPRSARDYGGAGQGYWNWTPAKRVIEALWTAGELAVVERRGFERRYDLTGRVIPGEHLGQEPAEEDRLRHFVRRAVRARGVVTRGRVHDYFRLRGGASRVTAAVTDLVDAGEVVPARVGDHEALVDPAALALADAPRVPAAPVLLCPFDNLIWDREETRRLFGFGHLLEIYKRPHERVYGYYVLPLLVGDRIAGRADLKADRSAGELRVVAAHWERRPAPRALERALDRLGHALGLRPAA